MCIFNLKQCCLLVFGICFILLESINMAGFYAKPSYMTGGNYIVYSGARRQRGGAFLGSFKSAMAPVGRGILSGAKVAGRHMLTGAKYAGRNVIAGVKKAAKNETVRQIAKQAVQKGSEIAASAAVDALQGRNLGEALRERSREVAYKTLTGQASNTPARPRKRKPSKLKQKANVTTKKRRTNPPPPASIKKVIVVKKKRLKKRLKRRKYHKKGHFSRAALNRNNLF